MGYRDSIYRSYATFFGRAAASYDNPVTPREAALFRYYFREWLPKRLDAAICDLGCGDGGLLRLFAARGYTKLVGIDRSAEQIERASGVSAEVLCADALDHLAAAPNRYDLLVARDVVEHLSKDELLRFLQLARAALRPGGRLVVQTPNGDAPLVGSVRYGDLTHELCVTPDLLERLLHQAGFVSIAAREAGPIPLGYSPLATLRYAAWQATRLAIQLYNLIEVGHPGSSIYTRVFLLSGAAPEASLSG